MAKKLPGFGPWPQLELYQEKDPNIFFLVSGKTYFTIYKYSSSTTEDCILSLINCVKLCHSFAFTAYYDGMIFSSWNGKKKSCQYVACPQGPLEISGSPTGVYWPWMLSAGVCYAGLPLACLMPTVGLPLSRCERNSGWQPLSMSKWFRGSTFCFQKLLTESQWDNYCLPK